jgi:cytoskeletal protein CcmA (bactofilin family)
MANFSNTANLSTPIETDTDQDSTSEAPAPLPEGFTSPHDELLADIESSRQLSVIGQTLVFKGELEAEEDLLIQGRVEGTVKHNARNLTIGAHGNVEADIEAHRIIVQGRVHGDMRASESVVVETSAQVVGNIFAPRIGIKEGAKFKGSIDMDANAGKTTTEPAKRDTKPKTKSKTSGTENKKDAVEQKKESKTKSASSQEQLSDSKVDEILD